jgi:hypothetical protein
MVAEASLVDLAHQVGQVLVHNILGFDVTLIIFTWPTFWCAIITTNFAHTSGYGYRCILENECLLAFGLYRV